LKKNSAARHLFALQLMINKKNKINITEKIPALPWSAGLGVPLCLLSVIVYMLLFIYLSMNAGSGMAITAILPVLVFSWFYGRNTGIILGLATVPANYIMALILGLPWWDKIFMQGAGVPGTMGCIIMGMIIGHMRDLVMKTNMEIADRKQTEKEILKHQDRLKEQTLELQTQNKKLEEEIIQTEQLAEEIHKTKDQLENFVYISLNPIVLADTKGNILEPNKAFTDMLGYAREEVIGKPTHLFIVREEGVFESVAGEKINFSKEYFKKSKDEMNRFYKDGKISNREIYFRRKDSKVTPVNQSIVLLKDEKGVGSEIFSIIRDITDQKKTEIALKKAKQVADEANLSKTAFLANMSHEMRTPMNGVIGFTDMLVETDLDPEQEDCARTIRRIGKALISLINDILDFSKIEAGKIDLEDIDFDVEVLAYDICELIGARIDENRVELLCRIDDSLPARIKGDPHRFRQVLINLMGNAAKFTRKGEIELSLQVEDKRENRFKLHTSIRDTGIGIPADKLETIFDLFQQADNSATRKYGGTGLGLSICKKIADIMDGDVWVESEPYKGSTFHFTAWLKQTGKKIVRRLTPVSLSGKKVLIADGNKTNLEILAHVLKSAGMDVCAFPNSGEALNALKEAHEKNRMFDICVFDIMIPGMSGYDVSREVRAKYGEKMPLLAFSSSIYGGMEKCQNAGYNGFLPKPINRIKLYKMMERLLGQPGQQEDSTAAEKEIPIVSQYSLREDAKYSISLLLAEDNPVNQKLATKMLSKAGYRVEVANNGREVLDVYLNAPEKYDVILMDVQMPQLNGLDATKILRDKGFKNVPIIAMTANAMKGDREKCLECGMNDYISKPIKREKIFQILRKWVFEKA